MKIIFPGCQEFGKLKLLFAGLTARQVLCVKYEYLCKDSNSLTSQVVILFYKCVMVLEIEGLLLRTFFAMQRHLITVYDKWIYIEFLYEISSDIPNVLQVILYSFNSIFMFNRISFIRFPQTHTELFFSIFDPIITKFQLFGLKGRVLNKPFIVQLIGF